MAEESRKFEDEKGDVSARMDELSQRITLYEKLQKQLLQIRLGFLFLVVLIACTFMYSLYHRLTHLDIKEMQNQAARRIALATPILSQHLMGMGQRVLPVYLDIIQSKAKEKLPVFINEAANEADKLLLHIKDNSNKKINTAFENILQKEGRYLLQQFPELENEHTRMELVNNVRIILSQALTNVAMDKLDAHLNAVSSIQVKLNRLKEEIKKTPERNVEFKLLAVTLELIGKKLIKEIYAIERGQSR